MTVSADAAGSQRTGTVNVPVYGRVYSVRGVNPWHPDPPGFHCENWGIFSRALVAQEENENVSRRFNSVEGNSAAADEMAVC